MKLLFFCLLVSMFLLGCAPSEKQIAIAVEQTVVARDIVIPTNTVMSTKTPVPTRLPTRTLRPTPDLCREQAKEEIDVMLLAFEEYAGALQLLVVSNDPVLIVRDLQKIKREVEALEVPMCARRLQRFLITTLDHGLEGSLAYVKGELDITYIELEKAALEAERVANEVERIANER